MPDLQPDDSLATQISPPASTEHPIVSAIRSALGALVPSAQAADPSKMIGGQAYAALDAKGNITLGGVKVSKDTLQSYVDRQSAKLANNLKMPQISGMKPLMDDMQEQITNAKEILAKAK
jgi:hypothetical protein